MLKSGLMVATLFVSACAGVQQAEAPLPGLPVWDGQQIVCNQEVSFAPEAETPLPVFAEDERLGFCARSMRYIKLHRQYGDQTGYFGAVAAATASLAATYAPLVRRAYSENTWAFLAKINREAEAGIIAAAQQAGRGGLGGLLRGGVDARALFRAEQERIELALQTLKSDDPERYAEVIREVNSTLNPTNRLLIAAINRNPFFRAYEAGLAQIRARHGGAIDYADIGQRVEIDAVLLALIKGVGPTG
ncbi:MAG: hypothetical protein L3J37_05985 [Rhodobacteraceae bacterium]|nr:hypothetical protein [Paracoccaceae bacterium]